MSDFREPRWLDLDLAHVWHPLTQHQQLEEQPLLMVEEARGATIVDAGGRRYIDTMAGLWCVNAGYGRESIARASCEQMSKLSYYPHTAANQPAAQLARRLVTLLGGSLNRIYFTSSGSESNEAAFKIARQYGRQARPAEHRYKVIARHRAYHGTTMGALSASGQSERRWQFEPLVPGFLHAPPAYCYRCALGLSYPNCDLACVKRIESIITHEGPETVAAVIVEPIVGGGGILVPPPGYFEALEEISERYGVLLISDEVICGFGRTGRMFGYQTFGFSPDIVSMAKGISSAYVPLGAVATTEEIFERFWGPLEERRQLTQVNTFGGHPVACQAALANLDIIADEQLVERADTYGNAFLERLKGLQDSPHVGEVRGRGMLWGIEMVEEKKSRAPLSPAGMARIMRRALDEGVILGKNSMTTTHLANVITMSPPLTLTPEEGDHVFAVLQRILAESL